MIAEPALKAPVNKGTVVTSLPPRPSLGRWQGTRQASSCTRAHAIPRPRFTIHGRDDPLTTVDGYASSDEDGPERSYAEDGVWDIVRTRTKWLAVFCGGLVLSAAVIEGFEDIIKHHVELSFFVPLIMGHGGNTGSQTVSSLIRALALRQVKWRNLGEVVLKEAAAGGIMGATLGAAILVLATTWDSVSPDVALVVAMAMPAVSLWANGLAALITLSSSKLKLDPAMTSGPLMTTVVDTTGLMLYFLIAKLVIQDELYSHAAAMVQQLFS